MSYRKRFQKELDKLKALNPNDEASKELLRKIELNRKREGYLSDYQALVNAKIIEDIIVPDGTVNLFPYIQKKQQLVKEAMKDPVNKSIVEQLQREFKEQCKKDGYLVE